MALPIRDYEISSLVHFSTVLKFSYVGIACISFDCVLLGSLFHLLFRSMLSNFQFIWDFPKVFQLWISRLIPLSYKNRLCAVFNSFKSVQVCFMTHNVAYLRKSVNLRRTRCLVFWDMILHICYLNPFSCFEHLN